jgi:hypothetical protein
MPLMFTMAPPPARRCGHAARQHRIAPKNFSANPSAQSSSVSSKKSPRLVAPALLTSRWRLPNRAIVAFTTAAATSVSRKSAAWTRHSVLTARARLSSSARERATTVRFIPSAASVSAMARPMPRLAPVTMAVLPERPRSIRDYFLKGAAA